MFQYPTQVCRMGLLYYWTKECEQGIIDLKYDRKALNNTSKKFGTTMAKLPTALAKGWKSMEDSMGPVYRIRLENMITVGTALSLLNISARNDNGCIMMHLWVVKLLSVVLFSSLYKE